MAPCQLFVRVTRSDRLALLGEAEPPAHRLLGLSQDRAVGGPAPAADGSAPAMEEREIHAAARRECGQRALRQLQLPIGGHVASVLVGVAVPDHDRLAGRAALEVAGIRGVLKKAVHRERRLMEIRHRLEERDDVERILDPGVPGHQQHAQDVGRAARHAHHVRLDRRGPDPIVGTPDETKQLQRLVGGLAEVEAAGERTRAQEFRGQEFGSARVVRSGPRFAEAGATEDLRECFCVTLGVLA